jgi:hypothetical protein
LEQLIRLEPSVYDKLIQLIRLGVFQHVAAQAVGISRATFSQWLNRGTQRPGSVYGKLLRDVEEATCRARAIAEMQVKQQDPRYWLTKGPGKEDWGDRATIEQNIRLDALVEQRRTATEEAADRARTILDSARALSILAELGVITLPSGNGQPAALTTEAKP